MHRGVRSKGVSAGCRGLWCDKGMMGWRWRDDLEEVWLGSGEVGRGAGVHSLEDVLYRLLALCGELGETGRVLPALTGGSPPMQTV